MGERRAEGTRRDWSIHSTLCLYLDIFWHSCLLYRGLEGDWLYYSSRLCVITNRHRVLCVYLFLSIPVCLEGGCLVLVSVSFHESYKAQRSIFSGACRARSPKTPSQCMAMAKRGCCCSACVCALILCFFFCLLLLAFCEIDRDRERSDNTTATAGV